MENIKKQLENSKNNIEQAKLKIEKITLDIISNKLDKKIGTQIATIIYRKIIKDYEFICNMYFLKGINTLNCNDDFYLRLVYFFANLKNNGEDISNLKNPFIINQVIENKEYIKTK